jgi:hypothetical protein
MKKIVYPIAIIFLAVTACEKKASPVDESNAIITLNNAGPNFVVSDITVNPKDSIFFSYNVSSQVDMGFVGIQKNPTGQIAFVVRDTMTTTSKNNYSAVKRLAADSIAGSYVYHIVAHNARGVYIGHKAVIVTVKADYNYFTYRFLRVPDSTAKSNTCYMAATNGELYSFTTGASKSAEIDFGMLFDTTGKSTPAITTDDAKFSIYALSATQQQLNFYDISSWTKNATIFKKVTAPAFNTLTSAGAIRTGNNTNLASGTSNKITQLVSGNMVAFKTVSGKQGVLLVNFVNGNDESQPSYINVDVKIEK